ncbi:hypothetical protein GA0070616_4856 [Micromonospora nigra]|uniref:Uncharacterized protein n=1 Tax=Micromonospora nigra TaxID=145857 RepID=A0A1C6SWZ0_9ACTN|nr:hypothetical protein GA0070616_4856 [Micromonospora nigra]
MTAILNPTGAAPAVHGGPAAGVRSAGPMVPGRAGASPLPPPRRVGQGGTGGTPSGCAGAADGGDDARGTEAYRWALTP